MTTRARLERAVQVMDRDPRDPDSFDYVGNELSCGDARKLLALVEAVGDGAHVLHAMRDTLNTSEGGRIDVMLTALAALTTDPEARDA